MLEKLNELIFDPFEMNDDIYEEDCEYLWNGLTNLKYIMQLFYFTIVNVPVLFSLMYINIRSIPKYVHECSLFLYYLNYYFTIICLTENCYTVDNVDYYKLQGYNIINGVHTDRA